MSKDSPFLNADNTWKSLENATGVSMPVRNMTSYFIYSNNDDPMDIVGDNLAVLMNDSNKWVTLNTNTGETTLIKGYIEDGGNWRIKRLLGISEGLFGAQLESTGWSTEYINGFFNTSGELVIDLTGYRLDWQNYDYEFRFENGLCTFIVENENGVAFNLTIDTSGEIISTEPI